MPIDPSQTDPQTVPAEAGENLLEDVTWVTPPTPVETDPAATPQMPEGVTFVTPPVPIEAQIPGQPVAQKRVLIIEDERPLAHALELKLNHDGYQTTVASTGTDGLQQALSGNYDLILLDLILPELDGFEVLRQLREQGGAMPVIILSNLGQEEDRQRVAAYNVAQYCVKSNMPLSAIVGAVKSLIA